LSTATRETIVEMAFINVAIVYNIQIDDTTICMINKTEKS